MIKRIYSLTLMLATLTITNPLYAINRFGPTDYPTHPLANPSKPATNHLKPTPLNKTFHHPHAFQSTPLLAEGDTNQVNPKQSITGTSASGESQMTVIDQNGNLKIVDKNSQSNEANPPPTTSADITPTEPTQPTNHN